MRSGLLFPLALGLACCAAGETPLTWARVPPEQSGLTHAIEEATKEKPAGLKYPWMSPLVDINGDGHLDILYYGHHGGGAAIWLGKGDGTFALDPAGYRARWAFGGRDPLWWDFTGDGKPDAVGSEGSDIAGRLFVNDGTGHWRKTPAILQGKLLDLDGDGHHDELWQSRGVAATLEPKPRSWGAEPPDKIAITPVWKAEDLLGWPEGEERSAHPGGPQFHTAFSVDLDGDHRNELIVMFLAGMFSGRMHAWVLDRDPQAQGAAGWKDATAARGLPAGKGHWYLPEDLDADGDLDLIDLATGHWHANDGKGRFTQSPARIYDPAARRIGKPWDGDGEAELLDLDNDGRRDLVMSGDHTTANGVFLNLGGRFQEAGGVPGSRRGRKFGDVDGDCDLDMVVAGKTVQLHRNDTANLGLRVRLVPRAAAEAHLGCELWVYQAGKLGQKEGLLHYRQCFMERSLHRSNVLVPDLHVGLGRAEAADIRVRFPSGVVREAAGVKAKSLAVVKE